MKNHEIDFIQNDEVKTAVAIITSKVVMSLQEYACNTGFIQLMPLLLSPFTDPLNHSVYPAEIDYEGHPLKLTASMIFHKQLALAQLNANKIFIMSPNIRLEKASLKSSSNHLIEFSQFDIELSHVSMYEVIEFVDSLVKYVFTNVKKDCEKELKLLGRELPSYNDSFPIYSSVELKQDYGDDFETRISEESKTPCFVTNFKREFYDKETPGKKGHYNNFDLVYPDGFGEALSGAEREYEYNQIIYRMEELNMDMKPYSKYLEAAKQGLIPPTSGAGLGIQRLVRFICGKRNIKDVCLFDRSINSNFIF